MASTLTLGVIGAGNMGRAIVRGAIEQEVLPAGRILVVDVDPARRAECAALGCEATEDVAAARSCEQIMLAVKPQVFPSVADALGPLPKPAVVISIMAGLSSQVIRNRLGAAARIIRAMPNTPCQIGKGMTAVAIGQGASSGDETLAMSLFSSLGEAVVVDESHMYAVTAVSGSGPAYVFLLAESMQAAAARIGLAPDVARSLVQQTLLGAAALLSESGEEAIDLRRAVTSPRGTTEAAIDVMLDQRLPMIVADAIKAARDRGIELDEG